MGFILQMFKLGLTVKTYSQMKLELMFPNVWSREPLRVPTIFSGVRKIKTLFMIVLIYYLPRESKRSIQGFHELVDCLNIRLKEGSKMTSNFLAVATKLSNTLFEVLSGKSWARCYC